MNVYIMAFTKVSCRDRRKLLCSQKVHFL